MLDKAVTILNVKHTTGFDPVTTLPGAFISVTYKVGNQGPFTLNTPTAEFTEAYVEAETAKQANILRALGVVPT